MSGTAELLYGTRNRAEISAQTVLDVADTATVILEDAEILYVLFEARMAAVLKQLPASLHPSIPAVLGVTFIRARSGPLGAFELAWTGIACRTGIKPRHFVQAAFCDNEPAANFFSARYGLPCQAAEVRQRDTYDRVRGSVDTQNGTHLDLAISDGIPLVGAGATIKYSPPLSPSLVNGSAALVQLEAGYDFKRVIRGKPRLSVFDDEALGMGGVWPTHPIAGSHAVCDIHLMPARFCVDLETPAEAGGATRIER